MQDFEERIEFISLQAGGFVHIRRIAQDDAGSDEAHHTSSHSLRMVALARRSAGVPSNTIDPCHITYTRCEISSVMASFCSTSSTEIIGDLKAARQAATVDLEGLQAEDACAVQQDVARRHRETAGDQVEQGRLASAVGTDDGADHRTEKEADTADEGEQQDAARAHRADVLGSDDLEVDRRQAAGNARKETGQDQRQVARPLRVVADELDTFRVVAH